MNSSPSVSTAKNKANHGHSVSPPPFRQASTASSKKAAPTIRAPVAIRRAGASCRPATARRRHHARSGGVITITNKGFSEMNQLIGIVRPPTCLSTPVSAHSATVLPICS